MAAAQRAARGRACYLLHVQLAADSAKMAAAAAAMWGLGASTLRTLARDGACLVTGRGVSFVE